MVDIVKRVIGQTRARVFKGDTHYPGKVLSIFEPHTEAIRKGKAAKPTEFGKLVKIQEAEGQFITDYEVCPTRGADQDLWVPSLEKHRQLFGRPPRMAVADAGFASRKNEAIATELMGTWNDFMWPLIVLTDDAKYTLPVALANLSGEHVQDTEPALA